MERMPHLSTLRVRGPLALAAALAAAALGLAACGQSAQQPQSGEQAGLSAAKPESAGGTGSGYTATGRPPVLTAPYPKVMVIAEENHTASAVVGTSEAPYITQLATTYGHATSMVANYPVSCPSLAAYIIMTSGSQQRICDDGPPLSHQLSSDNIFRQLAVVHKQWRQYAESMTTNCQRTDGAVGTYLVRHAPPPYYYSERYRCPVWDVPLGTTSAGHLHDDLASGLPDFSFVTPNACNDMHGASTCSTNVVQRGDSWLAQWMPKIIASSDFQQSKLMVFITWDEGSTTDNHNPMVIVGKGIQGVTSGTAYTHCSTLRTAEELLQLPYLGCAATAASLRTGFHF
jgi:hypothetical protein